MKKLLLLGTIAAGAFLTPAAHAVPINGTLSVAFFGVAVPGSPTTLAGVTSINITGSPGIVSSGAGTGNLAIPSGVSGTSSNFNFLGSTYSFTLGTYGTFTEVGSPVFNGYTSAGQSSTLSYYLSGTFTPGTSLPGLDTDPASFIVSFTSSTQDGGTSYSGSGTLASPPNPPPVLIPEPMTIAVLGSGLIGLGLIRRVRRS